VGQARNIGMLLLKDMTSAHSNCFNGQKVENMEKTDISEWAELLEEETGYKIKL
jgi:Fe2+ or Zn2+ uptake regulation protein